MYTYDILLYIPEHCKNRVCNQCLDKAVLDPTGMSLTEKIKCIKWYLLTLDLLAQGDLPWEMKITFEHSVVERLVPDDTVNMTTTTAAPNHENVVSGAARKIVAGKM